MPSKDEERVTGRARGGLARAESLTPEQRKEIAQHAAATRWQGKLPQAICGSPDRPLRIGDAELQCYVLSDGTRVLSQGGFLGALGRHPKANVRREEGEEQIPAILQGKSLKPQAIHFSGNFGEEPAPRGAFGLDHETTCLGAVMSAAGAHVCTLGACVASASRPRGSVSRRPRYGSRAALLDGVAQFLLRASCGYRSLVGSGAKRGKRFDRVVFHGRLPRIVVRCSHYVFVRQLRRRRTIGRYQRSEDLSVHF